MQLHGRPDLVKIYQITQSFFGISNKNNSFALTSLENLQFLECLPLKMMFFLHLWQSFVLEEQATTWSLKSSRIWYVSQNLQNFGLFSHNRSVCASKSFFSISLLQYLHIIWVICLKDSRFSKISLKTMHFYLYFWWKTNKSFQTFLIELTIWCSSRWLSGSLLS